MVLRGETLRDRVVPVLAALRRLLVRPVRSPRSQAARDRAQLDRIVGEWQGVSHLRLTAVGHSDQTLIAARSRVVYTDNYELSAAPAQGRRVPAKRLSIDARVTVEGRGADEPLATGRARSLALNRRVEIAIDGLRSSPRRTDGS